MAHAPLPIPQPENPLPRPVSLPQFDAAVMPWPEIIRRQPDMQQGRALEILGHAIEYLVDSRMFLTSEPVTLADLEAGHILKQLSRTVFDECREVVPLSRRLSHWLSRRPGMGTH